MTMILECTFIDRRAKNSAPGYLGGARKGPCGFFTYFEIYLLTFADFKMPRILILLFSKSITY